jgi:hypothetical protein
MAKAIAKIVGSFRIKIVLEKGFYKLNSTKIRGTLYRNTLKRFLI